MKKVGVVLIRQVVLPLSWTSSLPEYGKYVGFCYCCCLFLFLAIQSGQKKTPLMFKNTFNKNQIHEKVEDPLVSKPGELVSFKVLSSNTNGVQASSGQQVHASPPAHFWQQG